MHVPYIKYIETLVAGRLAPAEVHASLEEYGLEFPLPGIQQVYTHLSSLKPDYFKDKNSPVDVDWVMDLGIDKMYGYLYKVSVPNGVDGIEGAFDILNDPLMYRLITSLAFAKITDEDIELIVNGKYNIQYSSDDIEQFLYYFFDVANGSLARKKEYVEQVTSPDLKKFYKLALKGNKDYLVGKLGAAPDKSFDQMLRDMMTDSYYNFKERSKADPELAQKWGGLAVKLTDRLERLEKETIDKQDLFDTVVFKLKSYQEEGPETRHIRDLEKDG